MGNVIYCLRASDSTHALRVKAPQYFPISPSITSRGLMTLIIWLLLTSLVSCSPSSNKPDEPGSLGFRTFAHALCGPGKLLPRDFAWLLLLPHPGPWSNVLSSEVLSDYTASSPSLFGPSAGVIWLHSIYRHLTQIIFICWLMCRLSLLLKM